MFENMLGQHAADVLTADIQNNVLPPSLLFHGPEASGKSSAALETARILSCKNKGEWTCACRSCITHKDLSSKDLLVIGPRPFNAEILACSKAYMRDFQMPSAKILFLRSLRKLLMRFSQIIWEGESEVSKFNALLESINDTIDRFCRADVELRNNENSNDDTDGTPAVLPAPLEKIVNTLVKDALKLEVAGINDMIPVAHIRRAAYWLHLTPDGKRKTLIIENAERMKDEARNSLLKTIEEPPPSAQIILCTAKPGSLLPTILSRLRPYQFFTRKPETEAEIIRRVFRDPEAAAAALDAGCAAAEENGAAHKNTAVSLVSNYLDGFLPVPKDSLPPLAALFAQTLAAAVSADPPAAGLVSSALAELRERGKERCEKAGLDTGKNSYAEVCAFIIEKCEKFQTRRLYGDFIAALQQFVFEATMGKSGVVSPGTLRLCELFRSKGAYSVSAVTVYNQNALYALEKLFLDLKESICRL